MTPLIQDGAFQFANNEILMGLIHFVILIHTNTHIHPENRKTKKEPAQLDGNSGNSHSHKCFRDSNPNRSESNRSKRRENSCKCEKWQKIVQRLDCCSLNRLILYSLDPTGSVLAVSFRHRFTWCCNLQTIMKGNHMREVPKLLK